MFLQVRAPRAPGAKPEFRVTFYLADVSIWRMRISESTTQKVYAIRVFFSSAGFRRLRYNICGYKKLRGGCVRSLTRTQTPCFGVPRLVFGKNRFSVFDRNCGQNIGSGASQLV